MSRSRLTAVAVVVVVALIGVVAFVSTRSGTKKAAVPGPTSEAAASTAANHFFANYFDADGRIVRKDQGGDTVSEGQAYGMLIAVATGDRTKFDAMWNWSKAHLMQTNGLLAWRWQNGAVVDPQGATDADMDAARALDLASTKFNDQSYATQARDLAKAIATFDVFYDHAGTPVLMAGPWATAAPYFLNPSYNSPRTEQDLAILTSDARWPSIEVRQRQLINDLLGAGKTIQLPPDWATLDPSGSVTASGPPATPKDTPEYSYDALRVPIRLADSCNAADKAQAAKFWPILDKSKDTVAAATFGLNGSVKDKTPTAVGAVAAAAAAEASGDSSTANRLFNFADQLDNQKSSYYGAAWAALGRIMFQTNWLGTCPTVPPAASTS